jgi:hypothetical protein
MPFISDKDFDALWSAMDIRDRGAVDPVQFIVFLSACGPQFEEVYKEQAGTFRYAPQEECGMCSHKLKHVF